MKLHIEDFIEMLERDDTVEAIANYSGVSADAVMRRFQRLPENVRDQIRAKRANRPTVIGAN